MNKQTVRDGKTDKQKELIYPDGLLDRHQDRWMETGPVSERQIDGVTLTLSGQQNTEGYSDNGQQQNVEHPGSLLFYINTVCCNINYSQLKTFISHYIRNDKDDLFPSLCNFINI